MDTASIIAQPESAADLEVALTHVIGQIAEVREQMKTDDAEIAQIKAENAVLKAESAVLKAETQTLREQTRAILTNLRSVA